MSDYLSLSLSGCLKPYVRMTQRSKYTARAAQEYLSSKASIAMRLKQQIIAQNLTILPGQTPLACWIEIDHGHGYNNRDADNELKAILDAGNGIAYPDDRWIDEIHFTRRRKGKCAIRFDVCVREHDESSA